MIVALLEEEVRRNFPGHKNDGFDLHCSHQFYRFLVQDFMTKGFLINDISVKDEGKQEVSLQQLLLEQKASIKRFVIPNIGNLNVIEDREQGYNIVKLN